MRKRRRKERRRSVVVRNMTREAVRFNLVACSPSSRRVSAGCSAPQQPRVVLACVGVRREEEANEKGG